VLQESEAMGVAGEGIRMIEVAMAGGGGVGIMASDGRRQSSRGVMSMAL